MDGHKFRERITYADPAIFDVFTFPLARGDARTALDDLSSVVMSDDVARKYFGTANPIGRRLRINLNKEYTVTGVLKPVPANSSIPVDSSCLLEI